MDFSPSSLFASLLVSTIGFVLFRYGRKQERAPQMVAGVVMMVGPYFTASALFTGVLGAAALGGLWWALRIGW